MAKMSDAIGSINGLLAELREKNASHKSAESNTEAGGYGTSSTHPTAKVEDGTQKATEGAQSADNERMVKEDVPGQSVNAAAASNLGTDVQASKQLNIGMKQTEVGKDPATEDGYKDKKDDPGTTHPATVGAEKYGSVDEFLKAAQHLTNTANSILADIANGDALTTKAAAPAAAPVAAPAATPEEIQKSAQMGYDMAAELGLAGLSDEQLARQAIGDTVKQASHDAALLGDYLTAFAKQAMEEVSGEDHNKPGDASLGQGGAVPEGEVAPSAGAGADSGAGDGGATMGPSGQDIDSVLQQLAAGEQGGGDPSAPPSAEELLEQIAAVLAEREMAPAELPSKMASTCKLTRSEVEKIASEVETFKKAGKFRFRPTTTKRAERLRDHVRGTIREIVGC